VRRRRGGATGTLAGWRGAWGPAAVAGRRRPHRLALLEWPAGARATCLRERCGGVGIKPLLSRFPKGGLREEPPKVPEAPRGPSVVSSSREPLPEGPSRLAGPQAPAPSESTRNWKLDASARLLDGELTLAPPDFPPPRRRTLMDQHLRTQGDSARFRVRWLHCPRLQPPKQRYGGAPTGQSQTYWSRPIAHWLGYRPQWGWRCSWRHYGVAEGLQLVHWRGQR
jgi:hypothetical protein